MKSFLSFSLFLLLICTSAPIGIGGKLFAQTSEAPTVYSMIDYMKVEPGMHADYRELEAVWRKIHQANINAGKYFKWVLQEVAFPNGTNASHNYVTRMMFRGEQQLADFMSGPFMPDNLESILTEEELAMLDRTSEIRKLVRKDLFSTAEYMEAEDADFGPGHVAVFNYFASPDGRNMSPARHLQVERDHWMAAHQKNIDAGGMMAWVLLTKELPYGDSEPYHSATIDVYRNMQAYLTAASPVAYMQETNSPEQMSKIMQATNEAASLLMAEVRVKVDEVVKQN